MQCYKILVCFSAAFLMMLLLQSFEIFEIHTSRGPFLIIINSLIKCPVWLRVFVTIILCSLLPWEFWIFLNFLLFFWSFVFLARFQFIFEADVNAAARELRELFITTNQRTQYSIWCYVKRERDRIYISNSASERNICEHMRVVVWFRPFLQC